MSSETPVLGAVPKMVNIAIINKSTVPLGVDFIKMVNALQKQVSRDFAQNWGIDCSLFVMDSISDDDYWGLVFVDDADVAQALGYHDKTPKGNPIGYVFVKVTQKNGEKVSVTASHELLEILGNPHIVSVVKNPANGWTYAREACDAVQRYSYDIDGVAVSDFVLSEWFFPGRPQSGKTSFLGKTTKPFEIAQGGYMPVQKTPGQWTQIFGSLEAEKEYNGREHLRTPKILVQELPTLATQVESTLMEPHTFAALTPAFQSRVSAINLDWSKISGLIQRDGPVVLDLAEELTTQGFSTTTITETLNNIPKVFIDLWAVLQNQPIPAMSMVSTIQLNLPPMDPSTIPHQAGGVVLPNIIQQIIQKVFTGGTGTNIVQNIIQQIIQKLIGSITAGGGNAIIQQIIQQFVQAILNAITGTANNPTTPTPPVTPGDPGVPVISVP